MVRALQIALAHSLVAYYIQHMHKRKGNDSKVPTVELFAGAGLLAHAFQTAGAETLLAVEADPQARATLQRNINPAAIGIDAREVLKGLQADLLIGGPPCQGFSSLGKRDALDARNSLSMVMVPWARELQPKVVVIENVPQFLESAYWPKLQKEFLRMGYSSTSWVLNASDFGAPQLRRRAFAVFSKIGLPVAPEPTCTTPMTVRQAFAGLPSKPSSKLQHLAPTPGDLALSRFKLIPPGGDKRDLLRRAPELCPPSWGRIPNQATDVWGRMLWDEPANTLRCCFQSASKGRYIHPRLNRVISLREGARLQGVPDDWVFEGDPTHVARQIGNGVPVPLGRAVAIQVMSLF